ncbi:MAG: PAS domain S-box protein [Acidobacteriota bacterium]|nr:PAS domain S-box protein [Acidobacteriota bacterium]
MLKVLRSLVPRARADSAAHTEQRQAQAGSAAQQYGLLRESDQTLTAVFMASPLAIVTLDPTGVVRMWNPAAERIYGWSAAEVIGQPLPTVPPELREEMECNHREATEGRTFTNLETVRLRKDGTRFDASISTAPLLDADGNLIAVVALVADITERKRTERALKESEERYRAFLEQSAEPIWRFEFDPPISIDLSEDEQLEQFYRAGHLAECNDVLARMYGFSEASEIEGVQLGDLLPRTEKNVEFLRAFIRAGYRVADVESEEIDRTGRKRSFLNNLVGMVEGGRLLRVWGTQRDTTERKEREEAQQFLSNAATMLASSLDFERTLERVAHLAVPYMADYCLIDMLDEPDAAAPDATAAVRRMAVVHSDPARAAAWREMQHRFPLDLNSQRLISRVLRTGQAELRAELDDAALDALPSPREQIQLYKEFRLCSIICVPLLARGRITGALTFITAESRRHYTPQDLALAQDLAYRAAQAIDNARLYLNAQEVNRIKDEFLATLSHELRTPLTPIIGWLHMIGSNALSAADVAHGLSIIGKNAQSLARLINDLLDMSAILIGKMRIERRPVALPDALAEAIEAIRPAAALRGIKLELDVCVAADGEEPIVAGDRTRLVQVFWNLLSNAVKFSGDGATVRVSCEVAAESAMVRVVDEGFGIAPDFLPRVFDRFRQADSSTTRPYGGMGIGLALVKSFIEAHGGTVWAESEGTGRGSRFIVQLPRLRIAESEIRIEDTADNSTNANAAVGARMEKIPSGQSAIRNPQSAIEESAIGSVLVIEDASDTLELLRIFFEAQGYRVTTCESGADALSVAAAGTRFDIIVSDIGLPNTDGYDLLQQLRRDYPHLHDVPALALTGYAAEQDVATALRAGYAAHLAKPVVPSELAGTVKRLLDARQTMKE